MDVLLLCASLCFIRMGRGVGGRGAPGFPGPDPGGFFVMFCFCCFPVPFWVGFRGRFFLGFRGFGGRSGGHFWFLFGKRCVFVSEKVVPSFRVDHTAFLLDFRGSGPPGNHENQEKTAYEN